MPLPACAPPLTLPQFQDRFIDCVWRGRGARRELTDEQASSPRRSRASPRRRLTGCCTPSSSVAGRPASSSGASPLLPRQVAP
jgi:hypothetical protein